MRAHGAAKAPVKAPIEAHRTESGELVVKPERGKVTATMLAGGAPATGQVTF